MTVEAFFDTNVLVYAAVGSGKDEPKKKRALELIESTDFGTSAQVLQEFFVTVVRKASRPLSAAQALEWIEQWTAFPCQAIVPERASKQTGAHQEMLLRPARDKPGKFCCTSSLPSGARRGGPPDFK
jgi:predicted nucleic acid-binding protein